MDKMLTFSSRTNQGVFAYVLGKDTNYLTKTAAEFHPQVAQYIREAKVIPGKTQLLLTALGAGEVWGCFPEGERVKLAHGNEKQIELIESGDLVLTHTNRYQPVMLPMARYYSGNMFTFECMGYGLGLTCTEEHPLMVLKNGIFEQLRKKYYKKKISHKEMCDLFKYAFDKAITINNGDYLAIPYEKATYNNDSFGDNTMARVLGIYLAEGCLVKKYIKPGHKYSKIVFTLGGHEKEIAEYIREFFNTRNKKTKITEQYQDHNAIRVEVEDKEFAQICELNFGVGAKSKFISTDIMCMPNEWQLHFLSGYLDGDGCQVKSPGRYLGTLTSSTASRSLAIDLVKLTARLGYRSSLLKAKQHYTSIAGGNAIYEISYERTIADVLHIPRFIKVKTSCKFSSKIDSKNGYIIFPVKKITKKHYEGTVYNLSVNKENTYTVNGFAVHNCNSNGDFFTRDALSHDGEDYGYKTFLKHAKLYKHHVNKDVKRSYGDVMLSVYNPVYHRVELIITIDHDKAPDIIEKVDNGEPVEFSMGCRVPWDECNVCGHRAKTQKEYCEHAKYYLGRIHPGTGKLVYVINRHPKFFDISYVTIGADKIAKGLLKVAHQSGQVISSAEIAEKEAAMNKEVSTSEGPSSQANIDSMVRAIADVKSHEKEIPTEVLDSLAKKHTLQQIMATMSALGILPKPQEFQRILLINNNEQGLADELSRRNICFDPSLCDSPSVEMLNGIGVEPHNFNESIMNSLSDFVPSRSYAAPHLLKRIIIIEKTAAENNLKFPIFYDSSKHDIDARPKLGIAPIMLLASGLYAALAKKAPEMAVGKLGGLLARYPGLAAALASSVPLVFNNIFGANGKGNYVDGLEPEIDTMASKIEHERHKSFTKVASGNIKASLGRIMLGVPAAYMASGILQKHKNMNPETEEGNIRKFIRRNPDIIGSLVAVDGIMSASGSGTHGLFSKMFKHASVEDYVTNAITWPLAFGSKALPGRMLGGFMDQALIEGSKKLLSKKQNNDKIN